MRLNRIRITKECLQEAVTPSNPGYVDALPEEEQMAIEMERRSNHWNESKVSYLVNIEEFVYHYEIPDSLIDSLLTKADVERAMRRLQKSRGTSSKALYPYLDKIISSRMRGGEPVHDFVEFSKHIPEERLVQVTFAKLYYQGKEVMKTDYDDDIFQKLSGIVTPRINQYIAQVIKENDMQVERVASQGRTRYSGHLYTRRETFYKFK